MEPTQPNKAVKAEAGTVTGTGEGGQPSSIIDNEIGELLPDGGNFQVNREKLRTALASVDVEPDAKRVMISKEQVFVQTGRFSEVRAFAFTLRGRMDSSNFTEFRAEIEKAGFTVLELRRYYRALAQVAEQDGAGKVVIDQRE